jgi:ATP-dependent DNA helicase DinG
MQRDVKEAGGNEVFWAGRINEAGIIISVTVGSRGNEDSVIVNSNTAREGHVLIHNHPSGYLEPSDADQNIAANATDTSLGFYIVNNEISDVYVVVEPIKPKVIAKLDIEKTAAYLSKEGPLAKQSPLYEERPTQIELLKKICEAFNDSKIGVFEAGTGVGKSYAYLIPAMLWALENKERVIISTGTINLQQQLVEKDIPAAQKIIGRPVKAVLLKGRQNYICMRRLADAASDRDLFSEETEIFDRIVDWAKTSSTGTKTDLTFVPPENLWNRINSESDACMGARCQYREQCFVMKVRKEAADANLIVVNHHLLFADIESRMNGVGYDDTAVLPPYHRIVFDEAHGIEDSATSFFSESITRYKVMKQLNLMYRMRHGSMTGFLMQVSALSKTDDFSDKAEAAVNAIKQNLLELDDTALQTMDNETTSRLYEATAEQFAPVLQVLDRLRSSLGAFTGLVREVIDGIGEDDKDMPSVWETKTVLRRLEAIVVLCKNFSEWNEKEDTVFWMQKQRLMPRQKGDEVISFVELFQTPLDIAPLMNMGVFEPMGTVVCTSATLRTGTTFSFWMRRTGISFVEPERVIQGEFESPFPYKTNMIFAVPNDSPDPKSADFQTWMEDALPRLIIAAGGRTMVLFTSYDSLKSAYQAAKLYLRNAPITLLKQGDDDRSRLLTHFKEDRESVLFGTDSFWEGVDVPGDSLSQVIMVKLPFAVPNDPVFSARSELVEKQGGSSFMELSVPHAVIKFRQGFGRLIRRSDDKGVVVVLDRRIVEQRYGKQFTTSVPMTRRMFNPLTDIIAAVEKFLPL